jgi:hypothetical protein
MLASARRSDSAVSCERDAWALSQAGVSGWSHDVRFHREVGAAPARSAVGRTRPEPTRVPPSLDVGPDTRCAFSAEVLAQVNEAGLSEQAPVVLDAADSPSRSSTLRPSSSPASWRCNRRSTYSRRASSCAAPGETARRSDGIGSSSSEPSSAGHQDDAPCHERRTVVAPVCDVEMRRTLHRSSTQVTGKTSIEPPTASARAWRSGRAEPNRSFMGGSVTKAA